MTEQPYQNFQCRHYDGYKRCPIDIKRKDLPDFFDYPLCRHCQEKINNTITRENDGSFYKYKTALGRHDFPISNESTEWFGNLRCVTSDGRNVNMADELNRLENIIIDRLEKEK